MTRFSIELTLKYDSLLQVYCEAYGGNLAVIETASEQQFLTGHIGKVNRK